MLTISFIINVMPQHDVNYIHIIILIAIETLSAFPSPTVFNLIPFTLRLRFTFMFHTNFLHSSPQPFIQSTIQQAYTSEYVPLRLTSHSRLYDIELIQSVIA